LLAPSRAARSARPAGFRPVWSPRSLCSRLHAGSVRCSEP